MTTTATFQRVYADAMDPEMTEEQFQDASKIRELNWRGNRMPLGQGAELYATICEYNEFQPEMLTKLQKQFPEQGIDLTPARESSVVVYLHVPIGLRRQVRTFVDKHFNADEVDWVQADTLRVWWD